MKNLRKRKPYIGLQRNETKCHLILQYMMYSLGECTVFSEVCAVGYNIFSARTFFLKT